MAAKKAVKAPAKAPAKRSTKKPQDPVKDLPKLTQEEILKIRLINAQARLAAQDALLADVERVQYLAKIDPQGKLAALAHRVILGREQETEARKEYSEVLRRAGARLGLDLGAGCTIDPETGAVTQHEKKE